MRNTIVNAAAVFGIVALTAMAASPVVAQEKLRRGEYLATIMDCGGCHTPGALTGQPDDARPLAGSAVGFQIPGAGIFYPPNLTPDETGLAGWSETEIAAAVRTGVRPDGRMLAPVMPYKNYATLSDADARMLAAYLKSLKPIRNKAPEPRGLTEKATAPYLTVVVPN